MRTGDGWRFRDSLIKKFIRHGEHFIHDNELNYVASFLNLLRNYQRLSRRRTLQFDQDLRKEGW